ncbi:SET domain-containing protein [Marinicella sp. W31]|uniref:SET domain-containing protein n=1 Tax=Marinicella sp. W31 TaxID=3023713 RepID=UPI003756BF94
MNNLSFLSAKTKKKDSGTHGIGLFAIEDIAQGEVVAVKGGYIMSRDEWNRIESSVGEAAEIQLSDTLVIAPRHADEAEGCMMALNHSCEPNVGVEGQITYITMRHVKAGEELLLDYAMIDDYDGQMPCNCGAPCCRKIIDGKDWQKQNLQSKYQGYFATFIQNKIEA